MRTIGSCLNHWMPPQDGIVPRIRIGKRWVNALWALPIGATALHRPDRHRAEPSRASERHGVHQALSGHRPGRAVGGLRFPWWLQLQHFLNMFFMLFIMRAGIQILADHPRLYWKRDCTPGTDWFRFQVPVPKGRVWTSKDDSCHIPDMAGHSWSAPFARPCAMVALLGQPAVGDQRRRSSTCCCFPPISGAGWCRSPGSVFPAALSTAIQYASLNFPVDHSWTRYNGLQQLSYFVTVFVAAPVSIVTGLMQSPAISNELGWFGRVFNRQAMRSVHFISFAWFVLFILAHGVMVFVTGLRQNTNHMFGGVDDASWTGFPLFVLAMAVLVAAWLVASPFTIRHARLVQRTGAFMVGWLMGLAERWDAALAADREGHLALLLAERHHAELEGVRRPRGGRIRRATGCGSAAWSRRRRSSRWPTSRRCRSRSRSPPISASRAGPASPNGAAFRCATSSTW